MVKGYLVAFNGVDRPFELMVDGSVKYLGNRGQNSLPISENMSISTNIDGGSAFMRIDTDGGRRSLFDIVDLTINAVETASAYSPRANANYKAEVLFELPARMGRVFNGIDWECWYQNYISIG